MKGDISAPLVRCRNALHRRRALPDPIRRQEATQATFEKFRDAAFDWRSGRHCVRLAHFHLRRMGHVPPTLPRVRSALGAKKALKQRGWPSVTAMLDSLLPRIAPSEMMLGDLAAVPGEAGLDAVFVCIGPRRLFGWREDKPVAVVIEVGLDEVSAAWRA